MSESTSTAATAIGRVSTVMVPVADQDQAIEFYTEKLGFEKVADIPFGDGDRWVAVVPRGAETTIALVLPREGQEAGIETRIGLERAVAGAEWTTGIVLRYGGFYGPGTSLSAGGEHTELIRKRRFPVVGGGAGLWWMAESLSFAFLVLLESLTPEERAVRARRRVGERRPRFEGSEERHEELPGEALAAFLHDRDLLRQEWVREGVGQLRHGELIER